MVTETVIWTVRNAPSRLPDEAGGSFASERDVLLWLGWSLETIAERERDEASKREIGDWKGAKKATPRAQHRDSIWERFKTWGRAGFQAIERNKACARISFYIFKAQQNAGEFDACERFQELFERAAFVVGGILNRSAKYLWKLRNEVCEFVNNLWTRERKLKGEGLKLKERTVLRGKAKAEIRIVNNSETLNQADFHDTRVRVNNSKINKGFLNIASDDFEAADAAEAVKAEAIPKFRGRLKGRGSVWRVFEAVHDAAERAHGTGYSWTDEDGVAMEPLYSGAHLFSWLRACFVAGKDLKAAGRLYADAVDRHRGTGSGKAFLPKMFARLYREAAGLPQFVNKPKNKR